MAAILTYRFIEVLSVGQTSQLQTLGGPYTARRLDSTHITGTVELSAAQVVVIDGVPEITLLPSTGSGMNWFGDWTSADTYVVGSLVERNRKTYVAMAENTNSEPPSSDWEQVAVTRAPGSTGLKFVQVNNGDFVHPATVTFGTTAGSVCEGNDPRIGGGGGASFPVNCGLRLTLASGHPNYCPRALVPSSTDTSAETVTFSEAHGYVTGTLATVSATASGLTRRQLYYLHVVDSTTISFHNTLADAQADTSRVNLTGNVTATVWPSGVSNTTIYFTPFNSGSISLYTGSQWTTVTIGELSVALGTLTPLANYDVFVDYNAGTPQLVLATAAWASNTNHDGLTTQDGVYVKSGDTDHLYVGSIRTNTPTTTIDDGGSIVSLMGGRRLVWNMYNRQPRSIGLCSTAANYTYTTATVRQAGGVSGSRVEYLAGFTADMIEATVAIALNNTNVAHGGSCGFGLDVTNEFDFQYGEPRYVRSYAGTTGITGSAVYKAPMFQGFHSLNQLEAGTGTGTTTWASELNGAVLWSKVGITGIVFC